MIWVCHVTTVADSTQNEIINACATANTGDHVFFVCDSLLYLPNP